MNNFLMEALNIKPAGVPSDMDTAITGARIKLDKGARLAIVCHMGDSTAAVVTFTLRQHNAATSGTSKDLSVANPYYHKAAALTVFTKVEPTSAAAAYDLAATFASAEGLVVFEVLADQLDINNGFYWASIDAADSTAAKILSANYIVHEAELLPAYEVAL